MDKSELPDPLRVSARARSLALPAGRRVPGAHGVPPRGAPTPGVRVSTSLPPPPGSRKDRGSNPRDVAPRPASPKQDLTTAAPSPSPLVPQEASGASMGHPQHLLVQNTNPDVGRGCCSRHTSLWSAASNFGVQANYRALQGTGSGGSSDPSRYQPERQLLPSRDWARRPQPPRPHFPACLSSFQPFLLDWSRQPSRTGTPG